MQIHCLHRGLWRYMLWYLIDSSCDGWWLGMIMNLYYTQYSIIPIDETKWMFLHWHLLLLHCNNSYITLKSTEWFYFGSQMSWKCCLPISTSFKLILWTSGIFRRYNSVEIEGAGCCCFRACPTSRQGLKTDPPREDVDFRQRIWGLFIHIFVYFWWSRYCKDMAKNFFQKEAKAKCWILPSLSSWDFMSNPRVPPPQCQPLNQEIRDYDNHHHPPKDIHPLRIGASWAIAVSTEVWGHQIFIGSWCKLWDVSGHPPFPLFSPPTCRFGYFGCWWLLRCLVVVIYGGGYVDSVLLFFILVFLSWGEESSLDGIICWNV